MYCGVMVRRPGPGGPALPHWVLTGTMWPAPVDAFAADEACRQWRALGYDTRLEVLRLGRHMTFRTRPLRRLLRRWRRRWRAGLLRYLRRRAQGRARLPPLRRGGGDDVAAGEALAGVAGREALPLLRGAPAVAGEGARLAAAPAGAVDVGRVAGEASLAAEVVGILVDD